MKSSEFRKTQLEREQQEKSQRKSKPKATASGWEKPGFIERVLARAEKIEADKSLAGFVGKHYVPQASAQVEPPATAKEKFESAVAELMETETDGDRHAALQLAKTRHSGLLRQMMMEANQ